MSAPKIKLYRLKRDFTTDNLSQDYKQEINDELLPVVDKLIVPSDILAKRVLTGVLPSDGMYIEELEYLSPVTFGSAVNGRNLNFELSLEESNSLSMSVSGSLSFSSSYSQSSSYSVSLQDFNSGIYSVTIPSSYDFNPSVCEGVYPRIFDINGNELDSSLFSVDGEKIIVSGEGRYTVWTNIHFVNKTNNSTNMLCSKHCHIYNGRNISHKPFVFSLKDGYEEYYKNNLDGDEILDNHESEYVFYSGSDTLVDGTPTNDYYINSERGIVIINTSVMDSDKKYFIKYSSEVNTGKIDSTGSAIYNLTKKFISEHENWVPPNKEDLSAGGHLYMGPDVYIGNKAYSPNSYQDQETGDVFTMGWTPCFVEPEEYSIYYRDGYVLFPYLVDSNPKYNQLGDDYSGVKGTVYASYAYICGVTNVYGQIFKKNCSYEDIYGSNSLSISDSLIPSIILREGDVIYSQDISDERFLSSSNKPWVKRNNEYMPMNVYVSYRIMNENSNSDSISYKTVTEVKPLSVSINGYDELTVKGK